MAGSPNTNALGRLGYAHSHVFASFPPYRVASIAAPIALCVMVIGIWLSASGDKPGNPPVINNISSPDIQACEGGGNLNDIIAACDRLIKAGGQSPHDVGLDYFHRGIAYLNENRFTDAVTDFTAAIGYIPNDTDAYVARSDAEGNMNDIAGVIRDSNAALTINPKDFFALSNLGNAYVHQGLYDKAIQTETAAIAISPTALEYSIRGDAYNAELQYGNAIQDYNSALNLNPSNEGSYRGRGQAELVMKNYDAAINDENAALRIVPGDGKAQNLLQQAEKRGNP